MLARLLGAVRPGTGYHAPSEGYLGGSMFRTCGQSTASILLALLPLACGDGGKQAAGPEASLTEHQDAASVDGTVVSPDLAVADSAGPWLDTASLADTAAPAATGMGGDATEAGGLAAACAPPSDIAR